MSNQKSPTKMPDVTASYTPSIQAPLRWVGMEGIALPMRVGAEAQQVAVKAGLYVSLDNPQAKGIHMSRLHLASNEHLAHKAFTLANITTLLVAMADSQDGNSQHARVVLDFEVVLKKPALLSDEYGYQAYPVQLDAEYVHGKLQSKLKLTVPYSSTCPCSAALARQLCAEAIDKAFTGDSIDKNALMAWMASESGSVATPHSQRSYAYITMQLAEGFLPDIGDLVFEFEGVVGTPVQTAVKRTDEQEFARLNAENLMFCEDAGRRIKQALEQKPEVTDYWFKVEHRESLHAHNAIVIDQKFNGKR